jgi:hypothetical protein
VRCTTDEHGGSVRAPPAWELAPCFFFVTMPASGAVEAETDEGCAEEI